MASLKSIVFPERLISKYVFNVHDIKCVLTYCFFFKSQVICSKKHAYLYYSYFPHDFLPRIHLIMQLCRFGYAGKNRHDLIRLR